MRREEGKALCNDLKKRLKVVDRELVRIKKSIPKVVDQHHKRLRERVSRLPEVKGIEDFRLMQEIALIVDKSDITEELGEI